MKSFIQHLIEQDLRDQRKKRQKGQSKNFTEAKKNCGCGQDPCITYGKQEINEAKGDLKDMEKIVKELKGASKMHLGQSKRLAKYLASLKDSIKEEAGPEGRELSKKVNDHFEDIRGFIGAISGGKANEFQDHVQDGVFSGHDNETIINNHGPLSNHGMVNSNDGDDYSDDINNYIDAVRDQHEYRMDVRDDSENFYMGEGKNNWMTR